MMWWMPRRAQSCCHVADANCVTQDDMEAAAHVLAVISFRGTASNHLVVLSIMVRM